MIETNVNNPEFWDHIYENEKPRWDIGFPTPVFAHWLCDRNNIGQGRIAVLGCGHGHDAILLAQHGFEVTAIDFAQVPLKHLEAKIQNTSLKINLLQEDIFNLQKTYNGHFDFVLEYTCFCAIAPKRREEYVQVVRTILKKNGVLIGLFFPLDDRPEGPPFTVKSEDIDRYFMDYFFPLLDEIPQDSVPQRLNKERFVVFQKK